MKIFNEYNQEVDLADIDLSLGYLKPDIITIEKPAITHYAVKTVYFTNNAYFSPSSEDDPRIRIIDPTKGIFEYIFQENEKDLEVKGMDIKLVIDEPAHTETEEIQRYILYRNDELELQKLPSRMNSAENSIIETQEELEETNLNIEDLILLMAEMLGGEEEEEIEEIEEEIEENSEENIEFSEDNIEEITEESE